MCTIMIIDDKDLSLELIHSFLTREGYKNVKKYESPLIALEEIKNGLIPDLVITDFRMPEMNGIQFLNSMGNYTPQKIPSIILTGDPGSLPAISEKITVLEKGRMEFFRELLMEVNRICSYLKKSDYKPSSIRKFSISPKRTACNPKQLLHTA